MSSWRTTEASSYYREAIKAIDALDPPAIGFSVTNELPQSSSYRIIIKQNNLLLQLLAKQGEAIQDLTEKIDRISKEKAPTKDFNDTIEDLSKRLEGLKLGKEGQESPKPKKKGPFYVFRDPLKILEEEKRKVRKMSRTQLPSVRNETSGTKQHHVASQEDQIRGYRRSTAVRHAMARQARRCLG